MSSEKVAIVTGSNKGIGYAIVQGLCEKFDGVVYLTSRDIKRGETAIKKLNELNLHPAFHQLDIDDPESVQKFHDFIKKKHGGIDLLVNNAAIAFKEDATEPFGYQAEFTVKTNYFSLLHFCEVMFPLLRQNARVVNISSSSGHLSQIKSPALKARFSNKNLTIEELNQLMREFIEAAKSGKNGELGWGYSAYNASKVGMTTLTFIQQRMADREVPNRNLYINAVHPGYVDTDMSSHKGPLSLEEGASAPLYVSLEDHGWKGQYVWRDSTLWDWLADTMPEPV